MYTNTNFLPNFTAIIILRNDMYMPNFPDYHIIHELLGMEIWLWFSWTCHAFLPLPETLHLFISSLIIINQKTIQTLFREGEYTWQLKELLNLWLSLCPQLIDLVTVFDAISTSRQMCEKFQCLYENLMLNNFCRRAVLKKRWFVN